MLKMERKELMDLIEKMGNEIIEEKGYDFDLCDVEYECGENFFKIENRENGDPCNDYILIENDLYVDEADLKKTIEKGFVEYYANFE